MTRIALLSSEPVRPRMAGIGIRYLQFARFLPEQGLDVVLLTPAEPAESAPCCRRASRCGASSVAGSPS